MIYLGITFVITSYVFLYIWFRKNIYKPVPSIIEKIRALRSFEELPETPETLLTRLPEYWNQIEKEILEVHHFYDETKPSEEKIQKALKRLINYFPEPIIIVDPNGRIKLGNQAFSSDFFGIDRGEIVPLTEVFREPDVSEFFIEETTDKKTSRCEMRLQTKSSSVKHDYIVIKIPYAKRNELGQRDVLMIFHDISEIKRINQMKTDFVTNVSHELRTPLTGIVGYLQNLNESVRAKDFEQIQNDVGIISENVERLNFLVQDLLQLASLEADVELPRQNENLRQLTQNAIKPFQSDIEKGRFRVFESYQTEVLNCNGRLMEQVLTNMIQNTLRYTPQGTEIHMDWCLSKSGSESGQQGIELIFSDNGPGISSEHLPRLFERFYRVDPHRSRERGGTGIGLAIVKHIIQRHNGTIIAHSELGKGLKFICRF